MSIEINHQDLLYFFINVFSITFYFFFKLLPHLIFTTVTSKILNSIYIPSYETATVFTI